MSGGSALFWEGECHLQLLRAAGNENQGFFAPSVRTGGGLPPVVRAGL